MTRAPQPVQPAGWTGPAAGTAGAPTAPRQTNARSRTMAGRRSRPGHAGGAQLAVVTFETLMLAPGQAAFETRGKGRKGRPQAPDGIGDARFAIDGAQGYPRCPAGRALQREECPDFRIDQQIA